MLKPRGAFRAALDAYRAIREQQKKKDELRHWVQYGHLDYQLLQQLINACPDDVEVTVGPLADGTTIKMRRVFNPSAQPAKMDYREREALWANDLLNEIKKQG
jgi:hypothetical protein